MFSSQRGKMRGTRAERRVGGERPVDPVVLVVFQRRVGRKPVDDRLKEKLLNLP
jgi:hypothetical protein